MENSNSGTIGGIGSFFQNVADKVYKLADSLFELSNDDKDGYSQYFLSVAVDIQNQWERIIKAHEVLMKNRESFGVPKFDNSTNLQAAEIKDPTWVGWTEEDEKYLGSLYSLVDKVIKYATEVKNGQRGLAWDKDAKDAVVLGTAEEPAIYIDSKGDYQLVNWDNTGGPVTITPASYNSSGVSGVGEPITITLIIVIGVLAVAAAAALWKWLSVEETKIKLAAEKDVRENTNKRADKMIASGVPPKDAYNEANQLSLEEAKALALLNQSRNPAPEFDAFKQIAWAALGITVVGGAIYAIYKFTSGGSSKETVREVIRSEPQLEAAESDY